MKDEYMKKVPHLLMELNSQFIWDWNWLNYHINKAEQFGYTGIIIHQQELLSILVSPSKQAVHIHNENLIHQRNYALQYLKRVSQLLSDKNLSFWLQGEATPQDDVISMKFPEFNLESDSLSNFWQIFYDSFLNSIFSYIPKFDGVILSLTVPNIQPEYWQDSLLMIWKELRQRGKKLILRDFIDTGWPRQQLPLILSRLPKDIRASLKPTELDFHPGFANHPHIAQLPDNKKWLEYDLWGTGYGWSFLPCYLAEEIQERLNWAMNLDGAGIEAITTRVCWQWQPGRTTFDSVNVINILGLQLFNSGEENLSAPLENAWLQMSGIQFSSSLDQHAFFNSIRASHAWLMSTLNILGRRLHYQSQIPETLEHARQLIHMDTRSARWQMSYDPFLPADDIVSGEKQRELVRLEKEKAMFIANSETQQLTAMSAAVVDPNGYFARALDAWRIAQLYGEMFQAVSLATTDAIWAEQYGATSDVRRQQQTLALLANKLERFCQSSTRPSETSLPLLLSPERLMTFSRSLTVS